MCDAGTADVTYWNRGGHDNTKELTNMRKIDHFTPFLAGIGIGVAASVLFAPESGNKTQRRIRDIASGAGNAIKQRANSLGAAAGDMVEKCKLSRTDQQNEGSQNMSDIKDKANKKIDDAADAAKKAASQVIDKSKDVVHSAGKKMEEGAKRLQDV
jgi:gas vesicle protein